MEEELLRIYPNDNMSFNIDNLGETNAQDFAQFEVTLEKEGKKIGSETFDLDIEPGNNYWYFLEPDENLSDGEYIYNITGKTSKTINGLKKGTPLGHAQKIFTVTGHPEEKEKKEYKPLELTETDHDLTFVGENFEATFSKPLGGLVSLIYNGIDYLNSKPLVTYWRPLTDTDLHLGYNYDSAVWLAATIGQQLLPEKFYFEKLEDSFKLTFVYRYPLPGGQESAVTYQIFPDGTIIMETIYSGLATLDTMPVFGVDFKINKNCDAFRYYGYGPDENYIDTTEGLDLGVYQTTVRRNFNKKQRPQESGNRTGVRWAEVYNSKTGKGIKFTALNDTFEFNALPYNTFEIEAADDPAQLSKISHTHVRIAGKVSGVGNGDSIPEWARIDAGEMIDLKFSISPIDLDSTSEKKPDEEIEEEPPKAEEVETKTDKTSKKETKTETAKAETKEVKTESKPPVSKDKKTAKKSDKKSEKAEVKEASKSDKK